MSSLQELFEIEHSDQRKKRLNRERQTAYQKRQKNQHISQHELGRMDRICVHCGAKFWIDEKDQCSSYASPTFAVCCAGSKVNLPPLSEPPPYLIYLYTSSNDNAALFRRKIRGYNSLLAC